MNPNSVCQCSQIEELTMRMHFLLFTSLPILKQIADFPGIARASFFKGTDEFLACREMSIRSAV